MNSKTFSAKWQPSCLGLNVLNTSRIFINMSSASALKKQVGNVYYRNSHLVWLSIEMIINNPSKKWKKNPIFILIGLTKIMWFEYNFFCENNLLICSVVQLTPRGRTKAHIVRVLSIMMPYLIVYSSEIVKTYCITYYRWSLDNDIQRLLHSVWLP